MKRSTGEAGQKLKSLFPATLEEKEALRGKSTNLSFRHATTKRERATEGAIKQTNTSCQLAATGTQPVPETVRVVITRDARENARAHSEMKQVVRHPHTPGSVGVIGTERAGELGAIAEGVPVLVGEASAESVVVGTQSQGLGEDQGSKDRVQTFRLAEELEQPLGSLRVSLHETALS